MSAAQTLRIAAPGEGTDPSEVSSRQPPHLVLVPPAPVDGDDVQTPAERRQAFGPRLRAARERRGVTLDQIARSTKVSASLLAALERGDASRWPKGIYRRAYFRDYAAAIGLPAEPHITEFLQLFPDGEDHGIAVGPAPSEGTGALRLTLAPAPLWQVSPGRARRALVDLAAALVLAAAVMWWMSASPWTGAGLVAVCFYLPLTGAVGSRVTSWWRRRGRPATSQLADSP